METIYVLIEAESGNKLEEIVEKIQKIQNVREVHAVTGPFDIIVKIESQQIMDALQTVLYQLRKIKGVKSTETLVCIKMEKPSR